MFGPKPTGACLVDVCVPCGEMHGSAGVCLQVHGFSACGMRVGGAYARWEEVLTCIRVNFSRAELPLGTSPWIPGVGWF